MRPPAETFARSLDPGVTDAVRKASVIKTRDRQKAMRAAFDDPEAARSEAAAIKDALLEDLEANLAALISKARENGIVVHAAKDAEEARQIILDICRSHPGGVVKGKSMATEEIHLNHALEEAGIEVVETDLGEYVVQIDGDMPSHIVTPIIHKNRFEVARSFEREGLGPYTEEPKELAMQARERLRSKFRAATVGISGVNFAIVESGRLVIIENEGNNRLSTTAPDVHIAVMGIEKMLPSEKDLPLFLKLLAGSATGQRVTTYTHFVGGPRREDEMDGPREVHLVLLDAGRRAIWNSRYRAILRCIRCGACLNVCPVYRQVSGHGYGHVYPGPVGAVLAPLLERFQGRNDLKLLPKASSLCGACEEVCPVKIPIPEMLLHLRDEAGDKGSWGAFALIAEDGKKWGLARTGARLGPAIGWSEFREGPEKEGRSFRSWWKEHGAGPRVRMPDAGHQAPGPAEAVEPVESLWARFEATIQSLGGKVIHARTLAEGLGEIGNNAWIDPDLDPRHINPDIWEAAAGVTSADLAIAESGTVVLHNGPGRSRLGSLAPPIHIAVIRESRIVATLEDAVQTHPPCRSTVWITGSSRTADIEGVMVRGVHGPKEIIVLVLPD